MNINLNVFQTLAAAIIVYYVGVVLKRHISFFDKYCIPSPLIGGFVFAVINCILYVSGMWKYTQDKMVGTLFMNMFFASLGYTASLKTGKGIFKTGSTLVIKMGLLVTVLVVLQDVLGVILSKAFGLNPLLGIATGSIPLVGGHGTAGAFGPVLEKVGLDNATTIALASATFGLVSGGMLGGPVGNHLIRKYKLVSEATLEGVKLGNKDEEENKEENLPPGITIDENRFMNAFAHLLLAMGFGTIITAICARVNIVIPNYVGSLFMAALLRNIIDFTGACKAYQQESSVLGSLALNIFLSLVLMGMRLWQLTYLAVPLMVILLSQTFMMALFAMYFTFPVMGKNYEAAVMAAGNCGFGLGATPNALANMKAITERFGPAPVAFVIIPLVGALLVDIVNTGFIIFFINILK